jgi:hypothetical protein
MGSILFWLLASSITCAIVGGLGYLTVTLAVSIFIIWAILTWGGILILDDGFDLFT